METPVFTAPNHEHIESDAANFGVSPDNFIASWPAIGIEPFTLGQHGHSFVAKDARATYILAPRDLFYKAYERTYEVDTGVEGTAIKSYIIPDAVVDFARSRNVNPVVIVKVGMQLAKWAARIDLPVGRGIYVVKDKLPYKKGKITAEFEFGISPVNTVILHEKQRRLLSKKSI